jgi:hypothetical protein
MNFKPLYGLPQYGHDADLRTQGSAPLSMQVTPIFSLSVKFNEYICNTII